MFATANGSNEAGDENLRRQFLQLQEQQQQRLMQQKQKQLQKAQKVSQDAKVTELEQTAFGIDDDLELKLMTSCDQVSGGLEDATKQLNEQLREMKDENGRLYKLLSERDLELKILRKKREEDKVLASVGAANITNDAAATKIVELSKKLREQTAELESEKTKTKQFVRKCDELEKQIKQGHSSNQNLTNDPEMKVHNVDEFKLLQDKLKQSELKAAECRNQVQSLKAEMKVAQKVLTQEVGDGVQVQALLNSSSGWRGRAQQIATLQKKVHDLRKQLDDQMGSRSDLSTIDEEDVMMLGSSITTSRSTIDDKQKEKLRTMERLRKENQEKMATDLKNLEQDYESLKQKAEASKARYQVLSTENKTLKQLKQTLIDKGKHDDELIEALMKQQSRLKQAMLDSTKTIKERSDEANSAMKHLSIKQQQENNIVDQLKNIVAEREAKVKALEMELERTKKINHKSQRDRIRSIDAGSPQSTSNDLLSNRSSAATPDIPSEIIAEVLSPSSSHSTSRVGSLSRQSNIEAQLTLNNNNFGLPRTPSAQESNIKSVQIDPNVEIEYQEVKSLYQVTTVERDRLAEYVQVLEKRVNELTLKIAESQGELQAQRRRGVALEKQLGKFKVDKTQSATIRAKGKSLSGMDHDDLQSFPGGIEELQTRLDIQKDENEALKAALQSTLKAKEDDLKLYTNMLDETKKVFLQGIRQCRQSISQK